MALYICGTPSQRTGVRPPSCLLLENQLYITVPRKSIEGPYFLFLEFLTYKRPQVGFELPLIDDTSYAADALPTKPPRPDMRLNLILSTILNILTD